MVSILYSLKKDYVHFLNMKLVCVYNGPLNYTEKQKPLDAQYYFRTVLSTKINQKFSFVTLQTFTFVNVCKRLRTRAISERLRGVFTTKRYTNPRLLVPSPLHVIISMSL